MSIEIHVKMFKENVHACTVVRHISECICMHKSNNQVNEFKKYSSLFVIGKRGEKRTKKAISDK